MSRSIALVLASLALLPQAAAALDVPYLSGRVVDEAGLIQPDAEARINARLEELERTQGAQVAVLTVPSLAGENLEDYSLRVAETWALGREKFDDGALLLVARDDRKMRLEVGYGLEPVLTDAISGRILDGVLRPQFRAGDFSGGIEAGVEAIAGLLEGQGEAALPPPPVEASGGGVRGAGGGKGCFFFAFFLVMILPFSLSAIFSRGCSSWFLYLFLVPFWFSFPMASFGASFGIFTAGVWLVAFPLLWVLFNKSDRGRRLKKRHKWLATLASSRSGGSWSSGGSSGGFSGGGGSFGGGGASSSW